MLIVLAIILVLFYFLSKDNKEKNTFDEEREQTQNER